MTPLSKTYEKLTALIESADGDLDALKKSRLAACAAHAQKLLADSGQSLRSTATQMKISPPYLSDLIRGNRHWTVETIRKFEACLTTSK